jgi:hypothetical protein
MRLKRLFEPIKESIQFTEPFKTTLSTSMRKAEAELDFWNMPQELKNEYGTTGKILWTINMSEDQMGLELEPIPVTIKGLSLTIEVQDEETDEINEVNIEVSESDINRDSVSIEVGRFPLYLTSLSINMNQSSDPSEWDYSIELGQL